MNSAMTVPWWTCDEQGLRPNPRRLYEVDALPRVVGTHGTRPHGLRNGREETMTTLAEQMEAEALAERMKALDWLAELADLNDVIAPAEKRKKELTENLKQYMALAGMDELYDGEHAVTARFQDRKGTP